MLNRSDVERAALERYYTTRGIFEARQEAYRKKMEGYRVRLKRYQVAQREAEELGQWGGSGIGSAPPKAPKEPVRPLEEVDMEKRGAWIHYVLKQEDNEIALRALLYSFEGWVDEQDEQEEGEGEEGESTTMEE